jgi:hypothetical protein
LCYYGNQNISVKTDISHKKLENGSAENKEEQKEKTNEPENGQEKSVLSSNGAEKKKSYLPSLKNLNESVLAWIKSHVDKNPSV